MPLAVKLTTPAAIEQNAVALESMLKTMVTGEGEVAVTVYVLPPTTAETGAVLVKVMTGVPLSTSKLCWTWTAAFQLASAAWLASITHVPTAVKVTTLPAIEQNELALESMVKTKATGEGEVAVTEYGEPLTTAVTGAVLVMSMIGVPLPTAKLCCTCGAALQFGLPDWWASITHVPAPMKLTTVPAIEQTPLALASIVNATVRPEVAVAVGE